MATRNDDFEHISLNVAIFDDEFDKGSLTDEKTELARPNNEAFAGFINRPAMPRNTGKLAIVARRKRFRAQEIFL